MIKTQRAQLAGSTPVQLTFKPVQGVKVRLKNSGPDKAFLGPADVTPDSGYELLPGREDHITMPDSYHLYGCSADGLPTEVQVMEISR